MLFTLLIKGMTLPGSYDGIAFFFYPEWHELFTIKVWYNALKQLFFSLGIATGQIINYAAYNDFGHNIYQDGITLTCVDTFTSVLAGMTIFSILGNLAHVSGVSVKEVDSYQFKLQY